MDKETGIRVGDGQEGPETRACPREAGMLLHRRKGPSLRGTRSYIIYPFDPLFKDFGGDFSIFLELRNTAKKNQVPEACVKQGEDGCGGFGSWYVSVFLATVSPDVTRSISIFPACIVMPVEHLGTAWVSAPSFSWTTSPSNAATAWPRAPTTT